MQSYIQMVLKGAGYETSVCATIAQARKSFAADRPDLMLCDIQLPDGDGIEFCKELGLGPESDVRFLIMSSLGDPKSRVRGFTLGAQDFILKPVVSEELLSRVQVHLANKHSQDELARKNQELELRQRVRQAATDMIAHDLKNPLTFIKGALEITKKRGIINDATCQRMIATAGTATDHVVLMLNDFLDVLHADEPRLKPQIAPVALEPLLAKLAGIFAAELRARNIKLEPKISPETATCEMDQQLIFRVLVNLVSVALRASPRDETLLLECVRDHGRLMFTISDRGPSVPDEKKKDFFPRRLTPESMNKQSIGLAYCRLAADDMNGDLRVADRPGGGNLYILSLPAANPASTTIQ